MLSAGELIASLLTSLLANLVFAYKDLRKWYGYRRNKRILTRFWGTEDRVFHICYPVYPNTAVGRTMHRASYYLSDEDAQAVEKLERTLRGLGFKTQRITDEKVYSIDSLPPGAIVSVCGPKFDKSDNRVSPSPQIGGNAVSSLIYQKYSRSLRLTLRHGPTISRKEYDLNAGQRVVFSPTDEVPPESADRSLLIRFREGERTYFLFWGIHGFGTLGAVYAATSAETLAHVVRDGGDVLAVIHTTFDEALREIRQVTVEDSFPMERHIADAPASRPDPFRPGEFVAADSRSSGLSYLWATEENVTAVRNGEYGRLRPVAAEWDLSLDCPCACGHCPYRRARGTSQVLRDDALAARIVERLQEHRIRLLVLTGGGEPLVSRCVEKVVELARSSGMYVTLYTNGLLLDRMRAYAVMANDVSEIRVSLDDISSESAYGASHGLRQQDCREAYSNLQRNVSGLLDLRSKNGFPTRIGGSFVISDRNIDHLDRSLDILEDWISSVGYLDYVVLRPAVNYWPTRGEGQYYTRGKEGLAIIRTACTRLVEAPYVRHVFLSESRFDDVGRERLDDGYETCFASNLWLNIGPNGNTYLCCETKHMAGFRTGNILADDLPVILGNQVAAQRREYPPGTQGCPTRLCKPGAANLVFNSIEDKRRQHHGLPSRIEEWLDAMCNFSVSATRESLIPSVSGEYMEQFRL